MMIMGSKDFTEPIKCNAFDKRVIVNGKPLSVDFRILSEESYIILKTAFDKLNQIKTTLEDEPK